MEDGERAVAPLRRFAEPPVDLIRPTQYVSHQALFDPAAPHGLSYYWKSEYVPSLSDALIETLAERAWGRDAGIYTNAAGFVASRSDAYRLNEDPGGFRRGGAVVRRSSV